MRVQDGGVRNKEIGKGPRKTGGGGGLRGVESGRPLDLMLFDLVFGLSDSSRHAK